jgi:hypothetical protein
MWFRKSGDQNVSVNIWFETESDKGFSDHVAQEKRLRKSFRKELMKNVLVTIFVGKMR